MKISGEPFAVYLSHRNEYITSHDLAVYRRDPALYQWHMQQSERKSSKAMDFGRLFHLFVLEPDLYASTCIIDGGPINPRTGNPYGPDTKAYAEWLSAQPTNKTLVPQSDHMLICEMFASIMRNDSARLLLEECSEREVTYRIDTGYACRAKIQARIDFSSGKMIGDLKTCDNLDAFVRDAYKYEYLHQIAHYSQAVFQETGEVSECYFLAVEKKAPFRSGVWRISPQYLAAPERENATAAAGILRCEYMSKYSGVMVFGCDDVIEIDEDGGINL